VALWVVLFRVQAKTLAAPANGFKVVNFIKEKS
jgi:hypothetical protein